MECLLKDLDFVGGDSQKQVNLLNYIIYIPVYKCVCWEYLHNNSIKYVETDKTSSVVWCTLGNKAKIKEWYSKDMS